MVQELNESGDKWYLEKYLSTEQNKKLAELYNNTVDNENLKSVQEFELAVYDFNKYAESVNDEKQRTILFITSAVLLSSFEYWVEQFELGEQSLWLKFYFKTYNAQKMTKKPTTPEELTNKMLKHARGIAKADAVGAAGGAAYGAYIGATAGTAVLPGVGSVTGAIVGAVEGASQGAAISSATAAVAKVGSWLGIW